MHAQHVSSDQDGDCVGRGGIALHVSGWALLGKHICHTEADDVMTI